MTTVDKQEKIKQNLLKVWLDYGFYPATPGSIQERERLGFVRKWIQTDLEKIYKFDDCEKFTRLEKLFMSNAKETKNWLLGGDWTEALYSRFCKDCFKDWKI